MMANWNTNILVVWDRQIQQFFSVPRYFILSLSALTLLGGMIRFGVYLQDPLLSRDAIFYWQKIQIWLQGGWSELSIDTGLMFPGLVRRLMQCGLSFEVAGVGCNLLAGTLLIAAVGRLGRRLCCSGIAGMIAAALIAGHPSLIQLSYEIQRESLYLLFSVLALDAGYEGIVEARRIFMMLAGVMTAWAAATRYEGIELLLFPCIGVWLAVEESFQKILFRMLIFLFFFGTGIVLGFTLNYFLLGIPMEYFLNGLIARIRYFVFC